MRPLTKIPSQARWAALILAPVFASWIIGAFPIPWIDELVFVDTGMKAISSGHLAENYWAVFDPAYGRMLLNNPPLYAFFCGAWIRWTPLGLEGLRLLQAVLSFGCLAWILESRRERWSEANADRPSPELMFLVLASCPYVFRAATLLRPDIFIFLIQVWMMLEIWDGTFLGSDRRALLSGALLALGGWLHYSAIILLPLAFSGLATRTIASGPRVASRRLALSALAGIVVFAPWLITFIHQYPEWKRVISMTQEAQKYGIRKGWTDYAWPVQWLWQWVPPRQQWAESAWGSPLAYHLWWMSYPLLWAVGLGLAWRTRRLLRGSLLLFAGALGTWFFVRYSEMWFAIYGLGGAECALILGLFELRENIGRSAAWGLASLQVVATAAFSLSTPIPSWAEWHRAEQQTISALEPLVKTGRERVYISSLPDPSVALLKRWPELQVTRGVDFPVFATAYRDMLPSQAAYLISEPWVVPGHPPAPRAALMDWDNALARASQTRSLRLLPVDAGDFRFWVITPLQMDARGPAGDATGPPLPPRP